ncbi:MAG: 50S ribosomal protein L25 [bacterium]
MQRADLHVEPRTKTGKGAARSLRRAGRIPAVVYGGDEPPQPVDLDGRDLWQMLHAAKGEHVLVNLSLGEGGEAATLTLLKEMQHDPLHGNVEHVDFQRVSADRAIYTTIPIRTVGSSAGVREGGILEHLLRELNVECLPLEIPDGIEVDVSEMTIGQSVHVSDLTVPDGIRVLASPESVVVLVAAPTKVVEVAEAAVVAEGEEGEKEAAAGTSEAANETTK